MGSGFYKASKVEYKKRNQMREEVHAISFFAESFLFVFLNLSLSCFLFLKLWSST